MGKKYEMITLSKYFEEYDTKCVNLSEKEIEKRVENYLLSKKRKETNAKILEMLIA